MPHPVVHFEICGTDAQRLPAFYGELFGWEVREAGPEYWLIEPQDGGIGGGFMKAHGDIPSYITVYVATDDLRVSLARAVELGGKEVVSPSAIPGVGRFAMFLDPAGNLVGLFEEVPTADGLPADSGG